MAAIAAISLIVGGIGVANVMLVTVRERTREIGVRRAVGATRRDLVLEFLAYAVVTSIIGGVLGLAVGIAGAFIGGKALSVTPVFSPVTVTLALVVAAAVGVLAGIGPALQASSVEPTMALRYESGGADSGAQVGAGPGGASGERLRAAAAQASEGAPNQPAFCIAARAVCMLGLSPRATETETLPSRAAVTLATSALVLPGQRMTESSASSAASRRQTAMA
jgi:hypothetical protein